VKVLLDRLLVRQRELETIAERDQRFPGHLLLLVRDVLALAGIAMPNPLTVLARITVGWPTCAVAAA